MCVLVERVGTQCASACSGACVVKVTRTKNFRKSVEALIKMRKDNKDEETEYITSQVNACGQTKTSNHTMNKKSQNSQ